jgi:hypothetical protein
VSGEIKEALRQRTNKPIPETGKWLAQVVADYIAYLAVPTMAWPYPRSDITSNVSGIGNYVGVARESQSARVSQARAGRRPDASGSG